MGDDCSPVVPCVGCGLVSPPAQGPPIGTLTVFDVLLSDAPDHAHAARTWAGQLWAAYGEHHATVRRWLAAVVDASC